MTLAYEMMALEFESQVQLLSRIQFLTRFGSNCIQITGAEGSGKTWLAQRYLEAWAEDQNQSLLMCYPTQSDSQQRAILLKQLVNDPLFNEHDPIIDSLGRMLAGQQCQMLIVVDDAHQLSSDMVAELWALVQKAQSTPNWKINVLLFSQKGKLDKFLSQISHGQEQKPLEVEIEPFSEQEANTFVDTLVMGQARGEENKREVKKRAEKCARLPGKLLNLNHRQKEKRIIIRSVVQSPKKALFAAGVAVLLAGSGYWWLNSSQPVPVLSMNTSEAVPAIEPGLEEKSEASSDKEGMAVESTLPQAETAAAPEQDTAEKEVTLTQDDGLALPPEVLKDPESVGDSVADQKRVVVPSTVVDALIEDQTIGGDGTDAMAAIIDEQPASAPESTEKQTAQSDLTAVKTDVVEKTDDIAVTKPVVAEEQSQVATPSEKEEPVVAKEEAEPAIRFTFSNQELRTISARYYTLQLAALTSKVAVQQFIDEHDIGSIVQVYETVRNGSQWFIVTVGNYTSVAAARRAENDLPASVQAVGPWAKSFSQVHREIDRAK
ncbi:AAA family ATPase [Vibrio sp. Of7-15]|uniref:AAA family ATPase n=1 Tax=Vibrio sp. Of7-15 TaxID=2724879 RepID=UPI001EF3BB9E|nr:AAA family ATPase [Vibrio sp. Of7-15]MCG7496924.1 AAA family ATPase [Vibrio sp. Of7-15]